MSNCSYESPTVDPAADIQSSPALDNGTIYPQIQYVSPGTLQSVTTPAAVPTGISRLNPGIIVVFTHTMENDASEMDSNIWLTLNGSSVPIASTLTANANKTAFVLTPGATLAANTEYTIHISNSAYADNETSLTLEFDNIDLTSNPLSPANPTTVEYNFTTENTTLPVADVSPPTMFFGSETTPADTTTGVAPDLSGGYNGYIEIVFNDNVVPMIDPTTVDTTTITLTELPATPITGSVILVPADIEIKTFRFIPDTPLNYSETYRITVSSTITDFAGNAIGGADYTADFTTATETAPIIASYNITNLTTTTATITWTTDRLSIKHFNLELDNPFPGYSYVAPPDIHDTTKAMTFSHTATGLAANTVYRYRISADVDDTKGSGAAFDTNTIGTDTFRTLPDATSDDGLSTTRNTAKSELNSVQVARDESIIIWKDAAEIWGQHLDTSGGTTADWDTWTNNTGVQIFNATGDLDVIPNNTDGAIVTRTNTSIFSESIYNNGGALGRHWAGGVTGVTIYNGGTASNAKAALSYSGYATITSGTSDLEYIYDSGENFPGYGALNIGDHVIIDTTNNLNATVSVAPAAAPLLVLNTPIISAGNLNYRIGDNDSTLSGNEDSNSAGTTIYLSNGAIPLNSIVTNNTTYTYVTADNGAVANPDGTPVGTNDYTVAVAPSFFNNQTITSYAYIANGTAETNVLFDNGVDFSSIPINVNDIVVNLSTGESEQVTDTTYAANGLLILSTGTTGFLFPTDNTNYEIIQLEDNTNFIKSGFTTGNAGNDITLAGVSAGVSIGDILYNLTTAQYAEITDIPDANTLTLSSDIFVGNAPFIIFSFYGTTYTWIENNAGSDNVYGKTVDFSDGSRVLPDNTTTSNFLITDAASGDNIRNPFAVSDLTGNIIVIYEIENGANWDIKAKKIDGKGTLLWGSPADVTTAEGIVIATNQTVNSSGTVIIDASDDGNGGAWILYENGSETIGVAHINTAGTVNNFSIATATKPVFKRYSATNIAVAYEDYQVVGSDTLKRIRIQRYDNSPATVGAALNVRSTDNSYSQINPRITDDTGGGFNVSWLESTYAPAVVSTLFAQHFNNVLTLMYGDDKFVATPFKDNQADDPYTIDHTIVHYTDAGSFDSGVFIWLDERTANTTDIYYQEVPD